MRCQLSPHCFLPLLMHRGNEDSRLLDCSRMATGSDRTGSRHSEQSLPDPLHFVHILAAEVRLARNPDCSDCSRADFRLLIPTSDCSFPTSDCCEGFLIFPFAAVVRLSIHLSESPFRIPVAKDDLFRITTWANRTSDPSSGV